MTAYDKIQGALRRRPKTWLVTGAAGFIGSHLVEKLLQLGQTVVGLDNYSTGARANLAAVRRIAGPAAWKNFRFIRGDIRSVRTCQRACAGADYVLHQAALGSVPRSIEDPLTTNECNVTGFLNMLAAARDARVRRFVYASSSAVYGDEATLPKREEQIGRALSPYAVSKYANELYAGVFARCYTIGTIGLRYFNVFGPRQDPDGPYAAVIPRWLEAMRTGQAVEVHGDGETSRDFCYVENAVQANILAAVAREPAAVNRVYNIACQERTTLNELFGVLREALLSRYPQARILEPRYRAFRAGDVRHSLADISAARSALGYAPSDLLVDGIGRLVADGPADLQ